MAMQPSSPGGAVERPQEGTLSDVVSTILDKGLVIDVFARVSLVGIELLRADVRVVVASVDTYLRFAEAANRVELGAESEPEGLPELMDDIQESGSKKKTKGALEAASDKLGDFLDTDEESTDDERPRSRREKSKEARS
jgi:gas vesicle structural protein